MRRIAVIPQWNATEPQNSLRRSNSWEDWAEMLNGRVRHRTIVTTTARASAT